MQALRRYPVLKDLLEPAINEINAVLEMNEQSRTALSELLKYNVLHLYN